jgi:hypothetical protein
MQPAHGISAGNDFTCAWLADATVRCWGKNDVGQLGDGTTTERHEPTPVPGLVDIRRAAAGGAHACALATSGQLWCWGKNDKGQLGDDSTTERHGPVAVSSTTGLGSVSRVTAGDKHTCAIDAVDAAWCWGDKGSGRLGDDTDTDQHRPARVDGSSGLGAVRHLSAGQKHTCAVDLAGVTWCWGDKGDGRLGDDTNTSQPVPVQVAPGGGLANATRVSAGDAHTCALRSDGVVFCWGKNDVGQLGDGSPNSQPTPVAVDPSTGMAQATAVTAGGAHTAAWQTSGDGWAWGANDLGQLGDTTTTERASPAAVVGN